MDVLNQDWKAPGSQKIAHGLKQLSKNTWTVGIMALKAIQHLPTLAY